MQLLPVGTELHMCSAVGPRMPDLGAMRTAVEK